MKRLLLKWKVKIIICKKILLKGIMEKDIIEFSLKVLNQVRVFHWMTTSYAQHKALGDLYDALNKNIDTLVETYMGNMGLKERRPPIFQIQTVASSDLATLPPFLKQAYNKLKGFRNKIKIPEIQNVVDELSSNINQTVYLLKLS